MQREGGRIQAHVLEPALEPSGELVPNDWSEATLIQRSLEHRHASRAPLLAVDPDEVEDGDHGAQPGIGGGGEGHLVDPLPELVVLGLGDLEENTLGDVVVERCHVLPAQDHLEIDLRGGLDQVGTP